MYTLYDSSKDYRPAVRLTAIFSRRTLSRIRVLSFSVFAIASTAALGSWWLFAGQYFNEFLGVALIAGAIFMEQFLTYVYHNSYYFRGLNSLIGITDEPVSGATYDVAAVTLAAPTDVTKAFCESDFGTMILLRTGIMPDAVAAYLQSERRLVSAHSVQLPEQELFSLIGLGKYLYVHDASFSAFLQSHGVTQDTFYGATRWVVGQHLAAKRHARWWSKDNLSQTEGIGREWSYGVAYQLQKFTRDIRTSAVFSTLTKNTPYAEEKITNIEQALARDTTANVLVIGEPGVGKMDLLIAVRDRITHGQALDAISGKHLFILDTNRLFAVHADKQSFEIAFLTICDEALGAGNTIIVIENLSTFIREAEAIDVYIPELLDEYLSLPQLQFIATDTPSNFHTHLETLGAFTRRFSEVLIDTPDLFATTRVLQDIALGLEQKHQITFTYNGLHAVTTAADRYLVEGVMPDKAIELLTTVAIQAGSANEKLVTDTFVYQVIGEKTGIPAGPIDAEEKELLLHLEDRLHQQVVGQDQALSAIARTMRRARAGIQATDKPIGSFLFLGPTGVGKTETAKALATIFFGAEDNLERLDMSEFSGPDALNHLIGTQTESGVLANLLHEHPYCVLLLDEFEKGHQATHDLFLQILDEGKFTDGRGQTVNARNCIIIATSNAGSDLIIKTVEQRKNLTHLTGEIIDHIIAKGTYRPELINRFDSAIVFEPLTRSEQTEVAALMLNQLYKRMETQGYQLTLAPDLVELLAEKGYDPQFGARPMQRVIQDIVEEKIAQLVIAGKIKKGDAITLAAHDFSKAELAVID